jgi:hypothetical protein
MNKTFRKQSYKAWVEHENGTKDIREYLSEEG